MSLPPLGPRDVRWGCGRAVGPTWDDLCENPPRWHLLWGDAADGSGMENGLSCDEHLPLASKYQPEFVHVIADCAMPGAVFVEELNTCRVPDDGGLPSLDAFADVPVDRELVPA